MKLPETAKDGPNQEVQLVTDEDKAVPTGKVAVDSGTLPDSNDAEAKTVRDDDVIDVVSVSPAKSFEKSADVGSGTLTRTPTKVADPEEERPGVNIIKLFSLPLKLLQSKLLSLRPPL